MTAEPPKAGALRDSQESDADRATMWHPRDPAAAQSVAQSVAQYSHFVSIMKRALPVAAGFLLLLVIVLPLLRHDDERFRIGMNLIKGSDSDVLSMTNARYFGTDDKGQPYSVTADGVRQRSKDDNTVDLVTPKAEISLTNGTFMSAAASSGTYDRDNQKLDLVGEVTVVQDHGNQLHTSQAVVMLKEGTASGRQPVSGEGPFGTMQASGGFDLSDRGKIVHFLGPAHLVLNPKDKSTPVQTPAPPANASPKAGSKP